ncbi:hypothetical protein NHH03_24725 [Stieleria sp. TO1_6]|uniref:hypothetical protein n=1 Tax=Stieleria tagensis TaxID=2956795 RepID=UPI00209A7EFA|nr:hypothetical protein [Stieleria tagensis]MCO8124964.1 hypothetical protein [Stieleria tagensis]
MIHYTCDRCKRTIDPETEARFVVEIDVRLANTVEPKDEDIEDRDQLAELNDQLQRELNAELGVHGDPGLALEIDQGIGSESDEGHEQYDLCEQCHEAFAVNPLGREIAVGYGFSNN